jgi:V8-like Glu-specific endopeptidase
VTGASWGTNHPNVRRTTGKVFFRVNGLRYTCSGSAVASPAGVSIVSTAGHCVHDGDGGPFVTDWVFYPRWNGAADATLGAWTASALVTTPLWADSANGFDDDAGFARVSQGTSPTTLTEAIAAESGSVQAISFAGVDSGEHWAIGYPASKKYKGNTLTYCRGGVRLDYDSHDTMAMPCDMTGGSSGGPWLSSYDPTTGVGTQTSLNSYGYASLSNVMFGPIFDADEQAAYEAAASGACSDGAIESNCAA